jgi:hypothetical protein
MLAPGICNCIFSSAAMLYRSHAMRVCDKTSIMGKSHHLGT